MIFRPLRSFRTVKKFVIKLCCKEGKCVILEKELYSYKVSIRTNFVIANSVENRVKLVFKSKVRHLALGLSDYWTETAKKSTTD